MTGPIEHAPCEWCGREVVRRPGESAAHYTARRSCQRTCASLIGMRDARRRAAEQRSQQPEHPPCTHCGGPVAPREDERPSSHQRRATCSPECADELRKRRVAASVHERDRPLRPPLFEIDFGNGFAAHTVRTRSHGRMPRSSDAQTYGGVTAAWAGLGINAR